MFEKNATSAKHARAATPQSHELVASRGRRGLTVALMAVVAVLGMATFRAPLVPAHQPSGADLTLEIKASKKRVRAGSRVRFIAKVANHGPQTATELSFTGGRPKSAKTLKLPAGCYLSPNEVVCEELANLKASETRRMVFQFRPLRRKSARVRLSGKVAASQPDPRARNNRAHRQLPVYQ